MTISVSTMLTQIGYALDDPNNQLYSQTQLISYVNEAQADIARRAEVLQQLNQIPIYNQVRDYMAPVDCLRVYKLEFFQSQSQQIWPLEYVGLVEMDSIWGINQYNRSAWPNVWTSWQQPPKVLIRLYPVPGQAGTITCYYYRSPRSVGFSDVLDIPMGWEDLIRDYSEFMALRSRADPRWSDAKTLYEQKLDDYIQRSRTNTTAPGRITTGFTPYAWYSGIGGYD